ATLGGGVGTALAKGPPSPPSLQCNGSYGLTVFANVDVNGGSCTLSVVHITGSVSVENGGSLTLTVATVDKNVSVGCSALAGCGTGSLTTSLTAIGGNLRVYGDPQSSADFGSSVTVTKNATCGDNF